MSLYRIQEHLMTQEVLYLKLIAPPVAATKSDMPREVGIKEIEYWPKFRFPFFYNHMEIVIIWLNTNNNGHDIDLINFNP